MNQKPIEIKNTYSSALGNNFNNQIRSEVNSSQPLRNSQQNKNFDVQTESLMNVVLMGAEMERLNNESQGKHSQLENMKNRPVEPFDDSASLENGKLRQMLKEKDFKLNEILSENQRLKDREDQAKKNLNHLNDENLRLKNLQIHKGKGGAWCC